jgi:hypothetical protein
MKFGTGSDRWRSIWDAGTGRFSWSWRQRIRSGISSGWRGCWGVAKRWRRRSGARARLLPEASVSRIHLLCPDPWPKFKHRRRRLVQIPFLEAVKAALRPGGEFLFMTDHEGYFEEACGKIHESGLFVIAPWEEDSFFYPKTDFQIQWEGEGKSMNRIRCVSGNPFD